MNLRVMIGLLVHIGIMVVFQVGIYIWVIRQRWFCSISDQLPDCFNRNEDDSILTAKAQTERYFEENSTNEIQKLEFDCSDEEEDELWYQVRFEIEILVNADSEDKSKVRM